MRSRHILSAVLCALAFAMALASVSPAAASADPMTLQEMIDKAKPGDTARVPAGTYEGAIVLKDGMTLVGEGADVTIIDGGGADCVVTCGKGSAIIGFTIRNGKTGVTNQKSFIGVFECKITGCAQYGVWINTGSGVVADNLISGSQRGTGVACLASNPVIMGNVILNHSSGIMAFHNYEPTAMDNALTKNAIGVYVGSGSVIDLENNVFDAGQSRQSVGQPLGESDVVKAVDLTRFALKGEGDVEARREQMDLVFAEKVPEHPAIVYDLRDDVNGFTITTLFPWATFCVAASTSDTEIASHAAYDGATDARLDSWRCQREDLPGVEVKNDALQEREWGRYALEAAYEDTDSYFVDGDGRLVFKRDTTVSNIEILVPAGYIPVAVNYPATFEWTDERVAVDIIDVGLTRIELLMEEVAPGVSDPYGLLSD